MLVHTRVMDKMYNSTGICELAIVDLFTKLIFGTAVNFSAQELTIVQALRCSDENISMDGSREMGVYLRALGVEEMIQLVSRVKNLLDQGCGLLAKTATPARAAGRL